MFTYGLSDLLSCGLFVGCFCIARILAVLNINYARSEILVSCLVYIDQCFFLSKLLIFFMECSNVVTLAEWYDGSFESQVDFKKPSSGSVPESPKICISRF